MSETVPPVAAAPPAQELPKPPPAPVAAAPAAPAAPPAPKAAPPAPPPPPPPPPEPEAVAVVRPTVCTPECPFTLAYRGHTMTFAAGAAFTADADLHDAVVAAGVPVVWTVA